MYAYPHGAFTFNSRGLQWKGGLQWSCFRPAVELLLCATLSCKILSFSLLFSFSCLFSIMDSHCAWVHLFSPPLLSSSPLCLSHPIISALSKAWQDGCRNIKVLVMIPAPPQMCSVTKVQGVWVWSVCTCHGSPCDNRPKGATASSRRRRHSSEFVRLFITSCRRLNSRFSALRSWILWMWPQGAEQWNFNMPHGQYYSTPECRAFQTISGELQKARRWVIYRVRLASALALASPGSRDLSLSHSRGAVMPLAGGMKMEVLRELKWEQTQFLQVFRRCQVRQLRTFSFETL